MFKFFWVVALVISSAHLQAQGLSGKILDSMTQQGIPFAQVVLVDYHLGANCDDQGVYKFQGTFPDRVMVKVSAFGYETKFIEIKSTSTPAISLFEKHVDIDEVTVSGPKNQLQRFNITHVETRSINDLNAIPSTNLGQAIENIPGVYNTSTGNGISKPVIRGLQGTRVISLLNGIRIENQQWGGDHGMGLTDLGIGSVEVIKGPASLLYGADALGGVIYYSDESFANQNVQELKVSSQFETNSLGTTNSLFYKGSVKGLRINAGGRFTSHADYQLPSKQFAKNSRYQEMSGKLGLGWSRGRWISTMKYVYSSAQLGIPGHTHDSISVPELFKSDEQLRKKTLPVQYFTNHIASFDNKFVFKKHTLDLLVGFTRNELEEFEEKVTIPGMSIVLNNALYTFKMNSRINERWSAIYGIQGMAQWQKNDLSAEERLVPDAMQLDNGVFATIYLDRKFWKWQAGVRADLRTINSQNDTLGFPVAFNKSFVGYNFAVGGVYNKGSHTLRMNISSGFRVPHLSELLSEGVHHGTLRYEKGKMDLSPEQAIQLDVAYEFTGEHLSLIANPFVSRIQDYIYLNPLDTVIEGLQVFEYDQLSEVYLTGFDVGIHYHPHFAHFLHVESAFSYIRGTFASNGDLSLMPQPRWSTSIIGRFSMKTKLKISEVVLQHSYFLPQNNVSQFETPSIDYSLLNLGATLKLEGNLPLQLQFGVRNIMNTKNINHLSRLKNIGLESPGRNVYVKLIITVNYEKK